MARTLLALSAALLAVTSAAAHHSYSDFFLDRTVAVEGDLVRYTYANPHILLELKTRDASVYHAEWAAPNNVKRAGVDARTLKVGDHLVVTGNPARDPDARRLARLVDIRRPRDGWHWSRTTNRAVTER
jgi:hypothetical protein